MRVGEFGAGCKDSQVTEQPIDMCLALVVDLERRRVLLGRKLRGFGEGKVIAPGGKLEAGESALEAAVRELAEETSLSAVVRDARSVGELLFTWADPQRTPFRVSLVMIERWTGEAEASAELSPFWCPLDEIPYADMWDDDRIWLPNVLRGDVVTATIGYDFVGEFVTCVDLDAAGRKARQSRVTPR